MNLQDLMTRRRDWIDKTGKALLDKKVDWMLKDCSQNNWEDEKMKFPCYYKTLAWFEEQIANKFEDEYCDAKVELIN